MKLHLRSLCRIGCLFSLIIVAGCVSERSPVTGETERYGLSWEQEKQLGAESDVQISQQLGVYPDEQVQNYVNEVGEEVLTSSHFGRENLPELYQDADFTFRVLDSPIVNAFALPGGYVYVTRGLLSHIENEAQLAVVLGHEIGHVAGRHSAQQVLKSQWSQLGLVAGVLLGREVFGEEHTRDILGVGGTVMQMLLNSYSRDHEREADQLGVEYAAREGYEAAEGAEFFRVLDRMAQESGSRVPSWQSTHPEPAEREQTILQLAGEYEQQYPMDKVNAERFYEAIDGMVMGDNPRQGFVENGVFYHPELQFRFTPPSGWNVQNETQVVLMVDPQQQAIMAFEIAAAKTPQDAARELLNGEQIQVIRHGETVINGMNAYVVEAQANTQNGPVGLTDVFVTLDGRVYSFLGYTPAGAYSNYRQLFTNVAQTFAKVNDPSKLNVQPFRLQVVQVQSSAPFRDFVPAQLPPGMDANDLAILSQVELDEIVDVGERIKIPTR